MRGFKVGIGLALLGGCATANPPQELVDARASYSQAEQGPAKTYKPDQLHEARTELDQAEQLFKDDPDGSKTRTMAYLANRKAQLAGVEGATAEALDQRNQTLSDASRTQAAGLQRARVSSETRASNLPVRRRLWTVRPLRSTVKPKRA